MTFPELTTYFFGKSVNDVCKNLTEEGVARLLNKCDPMLKFAPQLYANYIGVPEDTYTDGSKRKEIRNFVFNHCEFDAVAIGHICGALEKEGLVNMKKIV